MEIKVAPFIILFLLPLAMGAQQSPMTGKIMYEEISGKRHEKIVMWFSATDYMYYRITDDTEVPLSYKSKEDSIKSAEREELKRDFFKSQPPQTWYGYLHSPLVRNSVYTNKKFYCVVDTLAFVKWSIVADTMIIEGLLCQKALGVTPGGTKIEAWFAPLVPVAVAPFTLRGLPGLLIGANYQNNAVSLRMLNLEWPAKENKTIAPPNTCVTVSKEERIAILTKITNDALQMVEQFQKKQRKANGLH